MRGILHISILLALSIPAGAQSTGTAARAAGERPTFDVASVRQDKSETGVDRVHLTPGRLTIENVSLKRLIGMALGLKEGKDSFPLECADWLDAERFDVSATFPPDTPDSEALRRLKTLLEDRFELRTHSEMRTFPAYALVQAKDGARIRPSAHDGAARFRVLTGHASGSSVTMAAFADRLSSPAFGLDRRVVDMTELKGAFDVSLDWTPDKPLAGAASDPTTDSPILSDAQDQPGPSIFTAMQEQLGLKLVPRKLQLEVTVVDHANRVPTEN